MRFSTRILLSYFLVLGACGYFLLNTAINDVKPRLRQTMEDTLVDTANLLAEVVKDDVKNQNLHDGKFAATLQAYAARKLNADIWSVKKTQPNHRVYITDARGIVLFDSTGLDTGKDYSQWRDVYLTLRGEYGARSTLSNPQDETSSVMYIAAPIMDADKIIGVLTVAKPNVSVLPFAEKSERSLRWVGIATLAVALALGLLLARAFQRPVQSLVDYADAISRGERAQVPAPRIAELKRLAQSLEDMRAKLEGRAYIEQYAQVLTHELKSPLAGIKSAAELLEDNLPAAERATFAHTIRSEVERLQQVTERLLELAVVEQKRELRDVSVIDLHALLHSVIERFSARAQEKHIPLHNHIPASARVAGERFLLQQALDNLLANALAFTPASGSISVSAQARGNLWEIICRDNGSGIPDYALPRVTERFFSLPRPDSGRKSSGLGLTFVQQVAALHHGTFQLRNAAGGGAEAVLTLPAA